MASLNLCIFFQNALQQNTDTLLLELYQFRFTIVSRNRYGRR